MRVFELSPLRSIPAIHNCCTQEYKGQEMVRCNRGTDIVMLVLFIDSEFLYNIQANVSNKA